MEETVTVKEIQEKLGLDQVYISNLVRIMRVPVRGKRKSSSGKGKPANEYLLTDIRHAIDVANSAFAPVVEEITEGVDSELVLS